MKGLLQYLWPFLRKHPWLLGWGLVTVLLYNYIKVYSTIFVGGAFNVIEKELQENSATSTIFAAALWQAGGYLVFSLGAGIFLFFTRQTIIVMSREIEYDMKNQIYEQYQQLDSAFYRENRIGDLMNRISEDVAKVRMFLGPCILYGLNLTVTSCTVIYFMLSKSVELTLYCLIPLPLMSSLVYYISKKMNFLNHQAQKQQSLLSSMAQENFSGIRIVKAYSKLVFMQNLFKKEVLVYRQKALKVTLFEAWFGPCIFALVGVSTILSIYLGGLKVMAGELRVGDIAEFVVYINLLTWPFASIGWITSLTQAAIASRQRIAEFLDKKPAILEPATPLEPDLCHSLCFENVSVIYPTTQIQALQNISFTIEQGKTLGILGSTGSGKTTLAQLMLRIMDPQVGKITLDQTDLRNLSLQKLREFVAYVPQDVFLFSDTIYNNIAFGAPLATKAEVEMAAQLTALHDTILSFPLGYDTLLGERGINLSGGQKQRLAMARAFLKRITADTKSGLLILDDALSAVDTQTEKKILNNLKTVRKDTTTIIISQRISSILDADKVVVLSQGMITQSGRHNELLKEKDGFYAQQYQMLLNFAE